ncbi:MAG: ABC transporter substrate-binding protein [Dehalococcoidales bacterium]|jgi:peptide/nickel transport system substrate-binding protein
MKRLIFLTLAVILIFGLVLVGCKKAETTTSKPPTTTTPAVTTTPAPTDARLPNLGSLAKPDGGKAGGRLQLQATGNIANIGDPMVSAGPADAAFSFLVVEPLVIVGADGNLKPWLAEEIIIADDGSSITLKLRQGISFTDGTPFNADAAKYNLDTGINSTMWPNMLSVQDCVIIDNYTIKLNFKDGKWDWGAAKSLASFWSVMMFSPTALQNQTSDWKMTHVIGTGPFKLTEFVRDQKLVYDRNDDYWRGKPYLDGVDYNIIPDATVALLAYKSGQLDTIGVQAQDAEGLINDGFDIVTSTDMVFNMCLIPSSKNSDSLLADVNIRRAVEHSINKQALVDAFTYGYGEATNQEFCIPPYMDPTCVGYPYDIQAAKDLLTAAGHPQGIEITLWIVDSMPMDVPTALQDMMKDANITLNVEKVSVIQFIEMIGGGGTGWDGYVYSYGFPGTTVDAASTLINGPFNGNTTWISCVQPDDLQLLSQQAAQETDSATRTAMYQELSRRMTDDYCMWTFMYYTPGISTVAPYLKGHTIGKYTEFFAYTFAWLDK